MRTVAINGSPLTGKITGIERYMYEIIKRIDKLDDPDRTKIYLMCPEKQRLNVPVLDNIEIVGLGHSDGKIKISEIRSFLKKTDSKYFSLSGNMCIQRNAVICIHDIRPWLFKEFDPISFRIRCGLNFLSSKFNAGRIVTVSETSKEEMSSHLRISKSKITVIPNGWEHMRDIKEDVDFWQRHPDIRKGEYLYSLSSVAPHKNFKWIIENAKLHPEVNFIVGGKKWELSNEEQEAVGNVRFLGYVTDEENKTLMKNCKAFVHPSMYEGFGITPLEALSCGAPIFVSKAACLPEIFGGVASFFDPTDWNFNIMDNMYEPDQDAVQKVLKKYTWDRAAEKWYLLMSGESNDQSCL